MYHTWRSCVLMVVDCVATVASLALDLVPAHSHHRPRAKFSQMSDPSSKKKKKNQNTSLTDFDWIQELTFLIAREGSFQIL